MRTSTFFLKLASFLMIGMGLFWSVTAFAPVVIACFEEKKAITAGLRLTGVLLFLVSILELLSGFMGLRSARELTGFHFCTLLGTAVLALTIISFVFCIATLTFTWQVIAGQVLRLAFTVFYLVSAVILESSGGRWFVRRR